MSYYTREPFARNNANVTAPMVCACTQSPLGAYSAYPNCRRNSLRSPDQVVQFGPEVMNGYYGDAYRLRFPNYSGPVYQATIPAFNVPSATVNPNGPFMAIGSKYNPYFRLYGLEQRR